MVIRCFCHTAQNELKSMNFCLMGSEFLIKEENIMNIITTLLIYLPSCEGTKEKIITLVFLIFTMWP